MSALLPRHCFRLLPPGPHDRYDRICLSIQIFAAGGLRFLSHTGVDPDRESEREARTLQLRNREYGKGRRHVRMRPIRQNDQERRRMRHKASRTEGVAVYPVDENQKLPSGESARKKIVRITSSLGAQPPDTSDKNSRAPLAPRWLSAQVHAKKCSNRFSFSYTSGRIVRRGKQIQKS